MMQSAGPAVDLIADSHVINRDADARRGQDRRLGALRRRARKSARHDDCQHRRQSVHRGKRVPGDLTPPAEGCASRR